ncbi:MAG: AAA family ATPase [Verrucomicrobiota bacterium]
MGKLDHITIKGFKSIRHAENLALRDINVVIGPNGAGKSNFIGVFSFLHAIREGKLQEYVIKAGGAENVLHFGSRATPTLSLALAFNEEKDHYQIGFISAGSDSLRPSSERAGYWGDRRYPQPFWDPKLFTTGKEAGISSSSIGGQVTEYVRSQLDSWRLYHFHDTSAASPMKKTADVNDNRFLRPDGSNLCSFLHLLKVKHPESYQLIRKSVERVAPFFDDFRLEPLQLNAKSIQLEWKHKRSDRFFDGTALSDGTLRFIGLATLLLQPKELRPSVILVDEPELGLHPFAITLLASMIKQAAVETQVIVATQSPLLLDHFRPEDVLVVNQVEGASEFERLDPERLGTWLEDYSLGQLWEKNELGGRPVRG